jgi:hypothetical protein
LQELGGDPALRVIADPDASRFGLPPWRSIGTERKINVMTELTASIISNVVSWCVSLVDGVGGTPRD